MSSSGEGTETKRSAARHAACSQLAGAVSTISFYPLDVVKMRFMSQDGTVERRHNNTVYTSLWGSTRTIWKEEGLVALYRGAHVAVFGASAAWGVYMYLYRSTLSVASRYHDGFTSRAAVSLFASCASAVAMNPVFLVKTRMQLEETQRTAVASRSYRSFYGGVKHVVATQGLRGLWVGSCAQILLGVPASLNVPIYDSLKALRLRQTKQENLDLNEVMICTTVTRGLLMTLTHPLFVLKTRLQDVRAKRGAVQYTSLRQALATTIKREGLRGMYRGAVPALAQAIPRSITQFVVYEWCLHSRWL